MTEPPSPSYVEVIDIGHVLVRKVHNSKHHKSNQAERLDIGGEGFLRKNKKKKTLFKK